MMPLLKVIPSCYKGNGGTWVAPSLGCCSTPDDIRYRCKPRRFRCFGVVLNARSGPKLASRRPPAAPPCSGSQRPNRRMYIQPVQLPSSEEMDRSTAGRGAIGDDGLPRRVMKREAGKRPERAAGVRRQLAEQIAVTIFVAAAEQHVAAGDGKGGGVRNGGRRASPDRVVRDPDEREVRVGPLLGSGRESKVTESRSSNRPCTVSQSLSTLDLTPALSQGAVKR
jgi:hypothetical protein